MSPSAAECAAVVEVVLVVGVRTLAFVVSDARASVLVAPRGLVAAAGAPAATLPVGVVFPADCRVSGAPGATVTAFAAAPRVLFADGVLAVRVAAACFAAAGAVVDLVAVDFGAVDLAPVDLAPVDLAAVDLGPVALAPVDFAAVVLVVVDFAVVALLAAAPVAADFAAVGLVGAVALAVVLPLALAGPALLAADLLRTGVAVVLAEFTVDVVLPAAFAGALLATGLVAAGFAATRFPPAPADPLAFAVVDAFLPVRPEVAAADTVAVVARACPAVLAAAIERPARPALGTVSVMSAAPCAVRARAGAVRSTPALSAITFPPIYETTGAAWPRTAKAGKNTEPKAGRQTCHTI